MIVTGAGCETCTTCALCGLSGLEQQADGSALTLDLLTRFVELGGSLWVSFRADLKDPRSQIRPAASRLATLAG